MFLEFSQNPQENTSSRVSFLIKLQAETYKFIKNETLAWVFQHEFGEISKNTFFTEFPWATVSDETLEINRIQHHQRDIRTLPNLTHVYSTS